MGASVMGGSKMAEGGAISQLLGGLPAWAGMALTVLGIFAVAALAGLIIGRLYASVRYPDPEKQSVVSPKIKIAFLAVLVICGIWLYVALTQSDDALPVDGDGSSMEGGLEEGMDGEEGGGSIGKGGGGMVARPAPAVAIVVG